MTDKVYIVVKLGYENVDHVLGVFTTKVKAAEHIETLAENDYQYDKKRFPNTHRDRRFFQGFYVILIAELDTENIEEEFL